MTERTKQYPDIKDILALKAEGRRERASLSFAEKLDAVDALKARLAPIQRARDLRRQQVTLPSGSFLPTPIVLLTRTED